MAKTRVVRLSKELSSLGVFAIATGTTLSAGLFLLPGLAARQAGPAVVICYMLAVIPLIPAVFSILELSTAMPRAGGAYYFLDRSLGPLAGTVGGIGTWLALSLKTSFALIGMGAYIVVLLPAASPGQTKAIAVAFALFFGVVNWFGAHKTGAFQIFMVGGLLAILAWFLWDGIPEIDTTRFAGFFDAGAESIFATAGLVYISYVGVTKVASVSEEVKDPEKNLPKGILLSLVTVVAVYALCTLVMVGVLPMDELSQSLTPMADAGFRIGGRAVELAVVGAGLIAFASVANAGIFSASRYPLAMGRDHLLPRVFRGMSARRIPTVGILVTVALIVFLVVVLDPLKIAKLASTFQLLMFGLLCLAVIVMRESRIESYDPGSPSPWYPWMQIFGIVAPVALIGVMGWGSVFFSAGLVTAGLVWYFTYARDRIERHGAIYHVFERLGRERFEELEIELRGIMKEKGLREGDPFEEVVARAEVIDLPRVDDFETLVQSASAALAKRLPCTAENLVRGFTEGTRTGATPVSRGVALPHMRLPGIDQPELAVVRIRHGVSITVGDLFGETSKAYKTYAVFFLVSPDDDPGRHLRMLANLASHVDDDRFLARWRSARHEEAVRRLFLSGERHLSLALRRGTSTENLIDRPIQDLDLPAGTLVALIHRPGGAVIPRGPVVLREHDRLTIIGGVMEIAELRQRYLGEQEA